jgi:hypothetical protein
MPPKRSRHNGNNNSNASENKEFCKFFFRIYSPDGQGIMYKANEKIGNNAYECPGSRLIGTTKDGIKIWFIGGYSDIMPEAAMHEKVDSKLQPQNPKQTETFFNDNPQLYDDKTLINTILYFDGVSYWFIKNESMQLGKKRKLSGGGIKNKTKKSSNKTKKRYINRKY